MKMKQVLPVCVLSLAVVLGGCGKPSSSAPAEQQPAQSSASEAEAVVEETAEAKALAAYREILQAAPALEGQHPELEDPSFDYEQNVALFGQHYDLFTVVDINGDEIPELIALTVVNSRWAPVSVYTFADGSAVLLKDPLNPDTHGTFEQYSAANGAYSTYLCAENHIHSVWRGTTPVGDAAEENAAYALEGTTLMPVDCAAEENEDAVSFGAVAVANTAENAALLQ